MLPRSRLALVAVFTAAITGGTSIAQPPPRLFRVVGGLAAPGVARAAIRVRFQGRHLLDGAPRLLLDLPGGGALMVDRVEARRRGSASALWRGKSGDGDGADAVLTLRRGMLAGAITSRHGKYEVVPVARGESVVERVEPVGSLDCHPDSAPPTVRRSASPERRAKIGEDGDRVDVLVLYTPGARKRAGGRPQVLARIQKRIDVANAAFANSAMSMRIEAAGVARAPFDDHPTISTMYFATNDPKVEEMRDDARADLVAVVTASFECGQAQLLESLAGDTSDVFLSVGAIDCGGGDLFTHEIGHNLGFRHDPEYDAAFPRPSALPYSWAHWRNDGFRTLMAGTWCVNCSEIRQFSNPRLKWNGLRTGIVDERDNARASETTAPHVAAYRRSGRILTDDFESGTLDAWDRARGDLEVTDRGLAGSDLALAVPLSAGPRPAYVAHATTGAEAGVDLDLLLDVSRARLGPGETEILSLQWHGQAHTRLTVRRGKRNLLALYTTGTAGTLEKVAEVPLRKAAAERIGLRWRRAVAGAAGGQVRLLRGGLDSGGAVDLDNADLGVDQVRMGRLASAAGAAGELLIDDYRAIADPLPESSR